KRKQRGVRGEIGRAHQTRVCAQLLIDLAKLGGGSERAQRVAAEIALEADTEHRSRERRKARGNQREPVVVSVHDTGSSRVADQSHVRRNQRNEEERRGELL